MDQLRQYKPQEVREAYLDEVSTRMRGRLSSLELFETIREMREHIDATAAAYEEVGLDPASAMSAALEKFGDSKRIGEEVATAAAPRPNTGLAFAFLRSLMGSACLGAVLLSTVDLMVVCLNPRVNGGYNVDSAVGGVCGLVVGLVAWLAPFRPKPYAITLCVMLNALLAYTLYPFYFGTAQAMIAVELGIGLTLALFCLGYTSAKMARKAVARLNDDLPGPMKRARS